MDGLGTMVADDLAEALGVSMKGLRLVCKNAAPDLAFGLRADAILMPPVIVAVLEEMGLAQKTPEGRLAGVGGFSVVDFAKKTHVGATGTQDGAVAEVVAPVVLQKTPAPTAVQVVLVNQCPNPLFWRAKLAGRLVVVKELNATKRSRFKPNLPLTVWPLPAPADHFTTVEPK